MSEQVCEERRGEEGRGGQGRGEEGKGEEGREEGRREEEEERRRQQRRVKDEGHVNRRFQLQNKCFIEKERRMCIEEEGGREGGREGEEDEGESYERRRLNMVNMYCVCVASDIIRGRKGEKEERERGT